MKKITALLLALVLLTLPVLGMAASPEEMLEAAAEAGRPLTTTVSLVPGTLPVEEPVAAIINDLIGALGVRVSSQTGDAEQTDFALSLSGADVLTFSEAEQDGVTYINTSLLGQDTVAFTAEDGEKIVDRVLKLLVDGGSMTQDDADAVKAQLMLMLSEVKAAALQPDMTAPELELAPLMGVVENVLATAKTEDVTAQPKNSDPAAQKITFTMTGDDCIAVWQAIVDMLKADAEVMKSMDQLGQLMEDGPMTGAEMLDTLMTQATAVMAEIEANVEVALYLNEAGELTYAQMIAKMVNADEEELTMEGTYARLTQEAQVTHTATLIAQDNEQEGVSISLDAVEKEQALIVGLSAAEIKAGVTGEPLFSVNYSSNTERADDAAKDAAKIELVINDEESGEQVQVIVTVDTAAVKQGEDVTYTADAKLYLNSEEPMLGVKVESVTGAAVPSIVSADALRPGAMDDAEFAAFLNNVVMGLQINLMTVIQNLPASVQQLMMGE